MEKNIDDFLADIAEATKTDKMDTPGFKLSPKEIENLAKRLAHITQLGQRLDDIDEFRKLINSTKKYNFDLSKSLGNLYGKDDKDESDNVEDEKVEISSALKNKIKKIDKLFSSKTNDELTEKDQDDIEKASQEILDFFKTSANKKGHNDKDFKETGVNTWQVKAEQTFPCKLEDGDNVYYGLVRPPTGVITWQGVKARAAAQKLGVPTKLPIMNKGDKQNPNFVVERGADAFGKFMSKFQNISQADVDSIGETDPTIKRGSYTNKEGKVNVDFDFDDSKQAKEKVVAAMKKGGADYDSKAYKTNKRLNSAEAAIDKISNDDLESIMGESLNDKEKDLLITEGYIRNVSFWQNIAKIF